jgi:hypothetical protein
MEDQQEQLLEKMIMKLSKQIGIHNRICDRLRNERYDSAKHTDAWNDNLHNEYNASKSRIGLLLELITGDKTNN